MRIILKLIGLLFTFYCLRTTLCPRPEHLVAAPADTIGDVYLNPKTFYDLVAKTEYLLIPMYIHLLYIYLVPKTIYMPSFIPMRRDNAYSPFDIVDILGLLAAAGGTYVRLWAFDTLGHFFTFVVTIKEGHQLIQDGPYQYLMHPSYTGIILTVVGCFLYVGFRSPIFWLTMQGPLLAALALPRIFNEEEVLAKQFGQEFETYKQTRWRLFPYIW